MGDGKTPVRGFGTSGVGVGACVVVVLVAGAAFGLASLHAPKAVAVSAATARAVVTREDLLTHLWDRDTAKSEPRDQPYRSDARGSARPEPYLPDTYPPVDYGP